MHRSVDDQILIEAALKRDSVLIANNEFADVVAENYAKMQEELVTLKTKLEFIK